MKAQIHETSLWLSETQPDVLKNQLNQILEDVNFNCLGFIENHFKPEGYTALWLLSESHLALHTFPEEGKSYIQISCCNKEKYLLCLQQFSKII